MKTLLISLLAGVFIPVPVFATNFGTVPETGAIEFDVYRGNSRFGTHILRFEQSDETLRVVSDVDLRVRIGPLTVFRYEHDSVEIYENGQLIRLEAETLKDGERLRVDLRREDTGITGIGTDAEGNALTLAHPITLMPSSHWRGYSADQDVILNTETGEEMPVTISEMGVEPLEIDGEMIEATRIRLEGSLTLDLWYGPSGEWLRCQFAARGQDIVYIRRNI